MKEKDSCCYSFTVSKLIRMKAKTNNCYTVFKKTLEGVSIIACTLFLLESCTCERVWYCNKPAVCGDAVLEISPPNKDEGDWVETELCDFKIFGMLYQMRFGHSIPSGSPGAGDSVVQSSGRDSIRQNKSPIIIDGPKPGEYFATTVTAGSSLNFKSSNEDYGGGYGKHEPGVGFNIGVGTVLPFNKHWAVAPSVRFTQKNASEKLEYSGTGGGGTETYIDKYSYNYIGGTMLAQYRAGKHVSFIAGPEVNFLVAASVKNGGSSGTGEKQSLNKTSQKVGLDLLTGIKLEIPAGNKRSRWGVQLMYDHRLSRLNKKKDENGQDVAAYKMKSVQLGLAYNICGCNKKK
jgi:Outer membrane protein beta-barrel domain